MDIFEDIKSEFGSIWNNKKLLVGMGLKSNHSKNKDTEEKTKSSISILEQRYIHNIEENSQNLSIKPLDQKTSSRIENKENHASMKAKQSLRIQNIEDKFDNSIPNLLNKPIKAELLNQSYSQVFKSEANIQKQKEFEILEFEGFCKKVQKVEELELLSSRQLAEDDKLINAHHKSTTSTKKRNKSCKKEIRSSRDSRRRKKKSTRRSKDPMNDRLSKTYFAAPLIPIYSQPFQYQTCNYKVFGPTFERDSYLLGKANEDQFNKSSEEKLKKDDERYKKILKQFEEEELKNIIDEQNYAIDIQIFNNKPLYPIGPKKVVIADLQQELLEELIIEEVETARERDGSMDSIRNKFYEDITHEAPVKESKHFGSNSKSIVFEIPIKEDNFMRNSSLSSAFANTQQRKIEKIEKNRSSKSCWIAPRFDIANCIHNRTSSKLHRKERVPDPIVERLLHGKIAELTEKEMKDINKRHCLRYSSNSKGKK